MQIGGTMFRGKTLLITGKFVDAVLRRFSETEIKEIGIFTPAIKSGCEK